MDPSFVGPLSREWMPGFGVGQGHMTDDYVHHRVMILLLFERGITIQIWRGSRGFYGSLSEDSLRRLWWKRSLFSIFGVSNTNDHFRNYFTDVAGVSFPKLHRHCWSYCCWPSLV